MNIASSTGLHSTSGASGRVASGRVDSFLSAGKLSAASIFGHCRICDSIFHKRAYKIVVDGIDSHPFHPEILRSGDPGIRRSGDPEIDDDWLLVHHATDPKHPSSTSFFPKKEQGKGSE
jgi:hypothetical protein